MVSLASTPGQSANDSDDDALFLTAVIKCEQDNQGNIDTVRSSFDNQKACSPNIDGEQNWSSEEEFQAVCDDYIKSEYREQEVEEWLLSGTDSDLLCTAAVIKCENESTDPNIKTVDVTFCQKVEETTDIDENKPKMTTVPKRPSKSKGVKQNVNSGKLINHEIRSLQITQRPTSPLENVSIENETSNNTDLKTQPKNSSLPRNLESNFVSQEEISFKPDLETKQNDECFDNVKIDSNEDICLSDCSFCNTDSEVIMGFNVRDVVLMTSSDLSEANDEDDSVSRFQKLKGCSGNFQNDSSDVEKSKTNLRGLKKRKRKRVDPDKINIANKKVLIGNKSRGRSPIKKRKSIPSDINFLANSSETDCSSSSTDTKRPHGGRIGKQKIGSRNRRFTKRRRIRKKSFEEDSSDTDTSCFSKKKIAKQKLRIEQNNQSCSKKSITDPEKLVVQSSPQLIVVLEDIRLNGTLKNYCKELFSDVQPSIPLKTAKLPSAVTKEIESSDNSATNESDIVENSEKSSDEERRGVYTRSRLMKPGPKYRYRRYHTGSTDNDSEAENCTPKGNIEFESESSESSANSAVPSEEISDPDEENENDLNPDLCIVCELLGDLDLKGRSRIGNAYWCKCGHCSISSHFMRDYDRICCREMTKVVEFLNEELDENSQQDFCITKHPRFKLDVLDFKAYLRAGKNSFFHLDTATEGKRRYYGMLSYVRWIFDRLGPGDRVMLPACVSRAIRVAHMKDPNDRHFIPFRPVKICKDGRHCKAALGLINASR